MPESPSPDFGKQEPPVATAALATVSARGLVAGQTVTPADACALPFETAPAGPGFFARIIRNPARDWVLLFLVIQCVVDLDGYINSYSRWATLAAMAEDGSVCIDKYYQHTMDWAQTPDGHYYSNKAPGPALLGYPLFRIVDAISTHGATTRAQRDQLRVADRTKVLHVLSVATQAIPYGLVVLLVVAALQQLGFPVRALHVTALALLFGNTGSLFMNTYCGHGMATMLVLAMLLALHRNRPLLVGLFYGLATLCDYGAALFLFPLLLIVVRLGRLSLRQFRRFLLGGAVPGAAFAAYHITCFGSPFTLPNKYQNPVFVDAATDAPGLWGVLRLLPRPEVVFDLLWGPERGLLYTQPWVLLCLLLLPFLLWRRSGWAPQQHRFAKWMSGFALFSLVLVLWMNASFNGWHGGSTPGPRYLAIAFPALALAMTGLYTRAPEFWRQALVVAVVASVLLFVLVYSISDILAQPDTQLLPFYLNQLTSGQGKNLQRCFFIALGFAWVGWRAVRSIRRSEAAA
ncbi:MAG TPA: hypothetical protein VJ801_18885 [Polyangia bacterium]|jgi:hypothetical protein|nr:hypothetical protein [Polyangia bacterium]